MITPEFLQGCTDEQINMGAGWLEAKKANIKNRLLHSWSTLDGDVVWCGRYFKPSSYPNDTMPIAFANGIGVYAFSRSPRDVTVIDMWGATVNSYADSGKYMFVQTKNTNPLRAICEVYLLMSNEK